METKRLATVSIFIEDNKQATSVNEILSKYSNIIVSRMGVPYREKQIAVIVVIIDATNDEAGALSGMLGNLQGVSVKLAVQKRV